MHAPEGFGTRLLNGVAKFMKRIETGGFIVEFLIVDFVGLILPRTIQAYYRNKEELGHPNYKAAKEEFTREVLSSPPMALIALAALASSRRMFGSASHIKLDTMKEFKKLVSSSHVGEEGKKLIDKLHEGIVDGLYGRENKKIDREGLIKAFKDLYAENNRSKPEKTFLQKVKGFFIKDKPSEQYNKLVEKLTATNKLIGNDERLGITSVDSSRVKLGENSQSIGDLVEAYHNYSTDKHLAPELAKKDKEADKSLLEKIHDFKEGARKLFVTSTILATGAFLFCVPKLYIQNKQYPGLDGLVKEKAGDDKGGSK